VATDVDFFFSPASRYSYLASTQISALERDTGCRVIWRPVNGIDIRRLRGRDPFSGSALSGQYEHKYRRADAEAWAAFYGIPYQEPREFHFDYGLLVRGAIAGQLVDGGVKFLFAIGHAVYGLGRWPVDGSLLSDLAEQHGLDVALYLRAFDSDEAVGEMDRAAREAYERGAFGVPTFFVGERMFWGNDRLPLVRHALQAHAV
jgi:2-hydroxychromene-2-carboxylate isomerase